MNEHTAVCKTTLCLPVLTTKKVEKLPDRTGKSKHVVWSQSQTTWRNLTYLLGRDHWGSQKMVHYICSERLKTLDIDGLTSYFFNISWRLMTVLDLLGLCAWSRMPYMDCNCRYWDSILFFPKTAIIKTQICSIFDINTEVWDSSKDYCSYCGYK